MNYWFEGSPAMDAVIRNCRFVGPRAKIKSKPEYESTEAEPYYHYNLRFEDNVFDVQDAFHLRQTKGIRNIRNRCSDGSKLLVKMDRCADYMEE